MTKFRGRKFAAQYKLCKAELMKVASKTSRLPLSSAIFLTVIALITYFLAFATLSASATPEDDSPLTETLPISEEIVNSGDQKAEVILTEEMITAGFVTIERLNAESQFFGHGKVFLNNVEVPSDAVYSAPSNEEHGDLITLNLGELGTDTPEPKAGQKVVFSYGADQIDDHVTWKPSSDNAFDHAPTAEDFVVTADATSVQNGAPAKQSFLDGELELGMEVSPAVAQTGQPVTYTYTFKNLSGKYLFFPKNALKAEQIIKDEITSGTNVKCEWDEGNGWKNHNGRYLYLNPHTEATFSCTRIFEQTGDYKNKITLEEAIQYSSTSSTTKHKVLSKASIDDVFTVKVVNEVPSTGEPQWTLKVDSSKYYVEPSGEDVTYTYTVKNQSGKKLYYDALTHDVCSPISNLTGIEVDPENHKNYIPVDGEATWSCTTRISYETQGIATATFSTMSDGAKATSTGKFATVTKVKAPTISNGTKYGIARCDVIDFTTVNASNGIGVLGSIESRSGVFSEPTQSNAFPEKGSPAHSKLKNNKARMTTASATSSQHPEFVYYSPLALGDKVKVASETNLGIYRIHKSTGEIEKITGPHFSDKALAEGTKFGATLTNRLAFDATGRLWSFAQDGHLYSLAMNTDGTANGSWFDHGHISTEAVDGKGKNVAFESFQLGDIAFDGSGTMWILGSAAGVKVEDEHGKPLFDTINNTTFLFTLKAPQENEQITEKVNLVRQISGTGSSINKKGFYGLAFGADGKLYGSYDTSEDATQNTPGELYSLDLRTGLATKVFSSKFMARVQDLSSCAFPTPHISAEKTAVHQSGQDQVTYKITVRNSGNLEATGVEFSDNLPGDYVPGSAKLNGTKIDDAQVSDTNPTGNPFLGGYHIKSPNAADGIIDPRSEATVELTINKLRSTNNGLVCNQAVINTVGREIKTDDPTRAGAEDPTCIPAPIPPNTKIRFEKAEYLNDGTLKTLDNLGGAEFTIYKASDAENNSTVHSALGDVITEVKNTDAIDIAPGTYYLVESKAPAGLSLLPQPVKFTVRKVEKGFEATSDDTATISFRNDNGILVATVNDVRTGTLPKTGSVGFLPFALTGMLLVVLAAVWAQRRQQL
ncbi:SpaA isopeptide-forming pilin-related protein [Corynebacterium diphtheriae]|uniref:SpaA isopeptide-forming pilin-related protein n=2 Tax=Corynebacterium diphtheriae TaxID=1717 RepID=UPI001F51C0C3|nr:SpaA isopeptide-forming pilin-related protein [Corynebacterium diphtheriae]